MELPEDIFAIDTPVDPNLIRRKDNTMNDTPNNNNMIALLQAQRGMTTALIFVESGMYIYKVPPHLTLSVDDRVVVPYGKNDHRKIGTVGAVHDFADLDLDSGIRYKWVIDTIDETRYQALVEEEKSISDQLRRAEAKEKLQRLMSVSGVDLDQIQTPMLEVKK